MRRTDVSDRARRSALRLGLLALVLAVLPVTSQAAALIEVTINGAPVRLVADRASDRVLMTAGATRALFDLAGGSVYLDGGTWSRIHARYRPGYEEPPYRIELFGPGPVLSGFVTSYHVLFVGEQVCAELMSVGWMTPFVDPAVRALAMLDALQPHGGDPCQNIPFATYAATGWPLIAGKIDHPTIETTKIAFDYEPQPGELTPPPSFQEGDLAQLHEVAKAAGL